MLSSISITYDLALRLFITALEGFKEICYGGELGEGGVRKVQGAKEEGNKSFTGLLHLIHRGG